MAKPQRQHWLKLGILLFLGVLLGLWYWLELPCIPRTVTGIPCITCGMTRAWEAALHFRFSEAFLQHPMFWSVPLLILFYWYDGRLFSNPKVNCWVLGVLIAGLILLWLTRILGFLGFLLPL